MVAAKLANLENGQRSSSANLQSTPVSRADAASMLNVSERSVNTAALEVGADVRFENYEGDDALAFVISLNLHRRHLSESQRSMVAAKLANMTVGKPNSANLRNGSVSQSDAASMLNVSERSIRTAKAVQASAPLSFEPP